MLYFVKIYQFQTNFEPYLCREILITGLLFIAIGFGGIRPCISAFGGDQFELPKQEKQLKSFFTYYYIVTNAAIMIAWICFPMIR